MSRESELRLIERDLKCWQAGKKTFRRGLVFFFIVSFICLFSVTLYLAKVFSSEEALIVACVCSVAGSVVARSVMSGVPATWAGRINEKLKGYDPHNTAAFETLCLIVNEKKALEPDDVAVWLDAEKETLAIFRSQQAEREHYSFTRRLENPHKSREK
ncbi:hypothetical protein ACJVQT_20015 [Enterobacter huaxiensis]|uniref:hypothetical protein n=1 Tax=Enterobacter huaxiensis TaxID=2494702 RepID=UPI0021759B56|nr:hypothetical protein [Enterobacter huaxiensis]MCS5452315.1 hypothetical protein [Enterobacter huaxiensis]